MKSDAKLEEELIVVSKLTSENWQLLTQALESLRNLHFNGLFLIKAENYRAIMFDGTKDWRKIWRKTDLCFQIWHDESGKFVFTGLKIAISF